MSRIDPESRLRAGENVSLVLHPSRLHFFDRDTEAAIQAADREMGFFMGASCLAVQPRVTTTSR